MHVSAMLADARLDGIEQGVKQSIAKNVGGDCMKKLIKKIYLYFKGKEVWNAKMSEHLHIKVISVPKK